jgi:hypothetical protein
MMVSIEPSLREIEAIRSRSSVSGRSYKRAFKCAFIMAIVPVNIISASTGPLC